MKNVKFLALSLVFLLITTAQSMACFGGWSWFNGNGGDSGGATGAPLDGGLLAILAVAGITYFGARKKKKKAQE